MVKIKNKKVLNLYAGIGGNRKLWDSVDVTAVELDESIAAVYQKHFPDDTVIVGDAHQYLLEHYNDGWDFIWGSPPCPTHSRARFWKAAGGIVSPVYPDMKLYQEIIFLSKHCKDSKWNIENVIPYYNPLIPGQKIGRHMFWNNFTIKQSELKLTNNYAVQSGAQGPLQELFGFNLDGIKFNQRKDKMLRSCVLPELGKHIFDCAMGYKIKTKQQEMF